MADFSPRTTAGEPLRPVPSVGEATDGGDRDDTHHAVDESRSTGDDPVPAFLAIPTHTHGQWSSSITAALHASISVIVGLLAPPLRCSWAMVTTLYRAWTSASRFDLKPNLDGPHRTYTRWPDDALDHVILRNRDELAAARSGHIGGVLPVLLRLASSLSDRYEGSSRREDLDERINLLTEACHLLSDEEQQDCVSVLCDLAESLITRSRLQSSIPDLERAVMLSRTTLRSCNPVHPDRVRCLGALGASLLARFLYIGKPDDLEDAIASQQEALTLCPSGHSARPRVLTKLAVAFSVRYEALGDITDLDKSIYFNLEGLQLCGEGHPDRHHFLNNGALSLLHRFRRQGSADDLHEAIRLQELVLEAHPASHPERHNSLANLAASLLFRSDCSGDIEDIDHAIELLQESAELRKGGHVMYGQNLLNLGVTLRARLNQLNNIDDLHLAIEQYRKALAVPVLVQQTREMALDSLAIALGDRFIRIGNLDDLQEAITLHREALNLRPQGHPDRYASLNGLGNVLHVRFSVLHDFADLEQAMRLFEEGVALVPAGTFYRHLLLENLSDAYDDRFGVSNEENDAAAALKLRKEALQLLVPGRARRSECLCRLSQLYLNRRAPHFSASSALTVLIEGLADDHRNAQLRLDDGMPTLHSLTGEPDDISAPGAVRVLLVKAYCLAVRLLPRVAYFGLDLHSRLKVLAQAEDMANTAAGHALAIDQAEIAVELLEEGRGIFWAQALRLRTPFEDLPPALADELTNVARQLERDSHVLPDASAGADEAVRRRRQNARFEALLKEAHALPGLDRFMLHDSFALLRCAAERGPVVMLVTSVVASEAIVLMSAEGTPLHVPLPAMTQARLQRTAVDVGTHHLRFGHTDDSAESVRALMVVKPADNRSYDGLLAGLWKDVMLPIVQAMGLHKATDRLRPRVWLCPTSAFAFLPLHAAGVYAGNVECCSDYMVPSYTPTLSALVQARVRLDAVARETPKILLAAAPHPPGQSQLHFVAAEIAAIKSSVPATSLIPLPHSDDSTGAGVCIQTVLDRLPAAAVLHLACHGRQEPSRPLESGFVLQDGRLTVARLMQLSLPSAAVAFLSACETAKGDRAHADQTLHLAATMLFAGFSSVVGTMWTMQDQDGPAVARAVYSEVFKDGQFYPDSVPYALDAAVRTLRAGGAHPMRWATYIHMGA